MPPQHYVQTILWILTTLIHFSSPVEQIHELNTTSQVDVEVANEVKRANLWAPPTSPTLRPDFKQFQVCDNAELVKMMQSLTKIVTKSHEQDLFEWTTVSLTSIQSLNRSYLLLGGSARRSEAAGRDSSVRPRDGGLVILCEFFQQSGGLNPDGLSPSDFGCEQITDEISQTGDHEFLGASSTSIQIGNDASLIAYCDSLWRATSKVPVGRCFLQLLRLGRLERKLELSEFCQSGLQVANPCMAGHSIAFSPPNSPPSAISLTKLLEEVRFWVGQPSSVPHGRVQVVSNLFGNRTTQTIQRPKLVQPMTIGSYFGTALVDGFVTAPSMHDVEVNVLDEVVQIVGLHTPSGMPYFTPTNWLGSVKASDLFSGHGTSMVRLQLDDKGTIGLIVGAPYSGDRLQSRAQREREGGEKQAVKTNRGRIYLYCPKDRLSAMNIKPKGSSESYDDILDGPVGSSFFGFSLTRFTDIDGDGSEDVAVGAPDLDGKKGYGHVYLIRVLPTCQFDRIPIQILKGPSQTPNFGSQLPQMSEDLDFNQWPDIVIPGHVGNSDPPVQILASRVRLKAECRFTFPPWLSVRQILASDIIPVQMVLHMRSVSQSKQAASRSAKALIFSDTLEDKLFHQVLVDWNASSPAEQRFRLEDSVQSRTDMIQQSIQLQFDLIAAFNILDMPDIDSKDQGLYLAYRFLQPCSGDLSTNDEGSCPSATGIHRPLIDWSGCVVRVPVKRFTCYPHPECESDVSVELVNTLDTPSNGTTVTKLNETHFQADLIFGMTESSQPQLLLKVSNRGPTAAQGVTIEIQFRGNLRYGRLTVHETLDAFNSGREADIKISVTANETWLTCPFGHLIAPGKDQSEWFLRLGMYYPDYMLPDRVDFTKETGVTVRLTSGTPDLKLENNLLDITYRVVNEPQIRISYGPKQISSRMDNRTEPPPWEVGYQRRVAVHDLGPRIEHTFQVEYLGPTKRLKNVTFRIAVPNQLSPEDNVRLGSVDYLVYMFREIRATLEGSTGLQWVDLWPKLYSTDARLVTIKGSCAVVNAGEFINPMKMVGMDIDKTYSRTRRHAKANNNFPENDEFGPDGSGVETESPSTNTSVDGASSTAAAASSLTGVFHRIPREVVTTMAVDQGAVLPGVVPSKEPAGYFHLSQTFFFPQIRPKFLHQIPIWPIIVGIVLGTMFLALIIILLYCIGFFKRKNPGLRKARYSKGGADELEHSVEDQVDREPPRRRSVSFGPTRYERGVQRKPRGKHRGELTILHPSDLATERVENDERQPLNGSKHDGNNLSASNPS